MWEQTLLFIAMHYPRYTSLEVKGWQGSLLPVFSNKGLSVLHLGWSTLLRVPSEFAGPPSPTVPVPWIAKESSSLSYLRCQQGAWLSQPRLLQHLLPSLQQCTRPSMHQPPCGNYSRAGLISSAQASECAHVGLIQGWEEIQQIRYILNLMKLWR